MTREWRQLTEELAAWRRTGRRTTLWWRDDDAVDSTPAVERLLELACHHAVPLALAVIPSLATESLAERVISTIHAGARVSVLQHGYRHQNEGTARKKIELDGERPVADLRRDLLAGRARLEQLFGVAALPVMVPPWNRIAATLLPELVSLGYIGLSTEGARASLFPVPGLLQFNAHVDLIRWRPRSQRGFRGNDELLAELVVELCRRRDRRAGDRDPIGLLTHHAEHDERCWRFLSSLFEHLQNSNVVDVVGADSLFASNASSLAVTL